MGGGDSASDHSTINKTINVNVVNSVESIRIQVAGVYLESDEVEYMDCSNRVSGKPDFLKKWAECKKKSPKQQYIAYSRAYWDCKNMKGWFKWPDTGELVQIDKIENCYKLKPKPYEVSKYFNFVYFKNNDTKSIQNLKAYLIVSDGSHTADGVFNVPFALDGQMDVVTVLQRKILTEWEPSYSAICVSGRYENHPIGWQLYVGEPWHGELNEAVQPIWNYTPRYVSPEQKRGQGDNLNECIKLARQEVAAKSKSR